MAFMIPVVRNDWDVWMRSRKPYPPDKFSHNGQTTESRTGDPSLSTTPDRTGGIVVENARKKRSLAIEIRNQQHLRISSGSLPSNFQSAHVGLPVSRSSLRHGRPLTSRFRSMRSSYRIGNNHSFESESTISPIKPKNTGTASLPNCFESHPCFDCQSAKMPLKDLDKLTVVKLRAELIARGLDSKGNKPFLVERLRFALDQEEKHGVPRPAIKMFTSENELGDASMDQEPEMDDEVLDDAEADENEEVSSNPSQVGNGSNGTTEVSDNALNNGTHISCTDKPFKTEETLTEAIAEPTIIEASKQISADTPSLTEAAVKEGNADEADNSTNSALNDSVMAVYGGKNETFMENSTLEQSVDMTVDRTNDNVTNNVTSNSSSLDGKETSSTPKDTTEASSVETEKASVSINQTDASAQDETVSVDSETKEQEKGSDVTSQAEITDAVVKAEEPIADEKVQPLQVEAKEEEKMEASSAVETEATQESESPSKEGTIEDKNDRGSKRQRDRSSSPANVNKVAEGPPPEDEPEWDESLVVLDWYNSDLNLTISKTDFVTGTPLTEAGFAYMWAGARATYGFLTGKICYEVKVIENLAVSHLEESEPNHHVVRVGWSVDSTTYQLGEDPFSYGYGGTGKISQNCEFKDYGVPFQLNDVVGVYLDASEEKETVEISFCVNGASQGVAFTLTKEELNGRALFPHILTKNCRFEVNFGQKEEPWFPPMEGYEWASKIPVESRIRGARTPATRADCQMIMMCGLPGAGKTTWANKYSIENPDRKFNILGTNAFLDKMKVNGLPRRKNYSGRWEVLIEKCTRCLNILLEIAAKRRRNYILDQTNVYPTAQKRKMSYFSGFKRKAVVIVPTEEEAKVRVEKRIQEEGKDVPDSAVMEMKANFKIPSVDDTFSEVEFPELALEEALKVIEKYSTEAKAAGYGYDDRRNDRPSYSAPRREGPSPWMNSPSMAGAAPQRSSWGHSHSGWNSNSGGGNSSSSSYGQPQQSAYASSAYGGSALYGSAGASRATPSGGYGTPSGITARPVTGNYGSSSATARPVSTPYGGAGITGLARPASYGSNGPARPTSYGPPSLPGSRPVSYGSGSGSARPTSSYSSASINQWSQQQQQQPQQTGYQYPYNPNHSTYSGGK
ncbi:hypothetical protein GHT06_009238 [Daphnia sinensis]|uniref:Uncharacterized protein n=1 Tax=Daphnia sinensis TaxID=1820382 RepID=A0AAD5L2Q6_9CRUS|nr:hypothetical protein GHT06_009238 [Daphnia sinensis]